MQNNRIDFQGIDYVSWAAGFDFEFARLAARRVSAAMESALDEAMFDCRHEDKHLVFKSISGAAAFDEHKNELLISFTHNCREGRDKTTIRTMRLVQDKYTIARVVSEALAELLAGVFNEKPAEQPTVEE